MTEFVDITHPDIAAHGRVARTALPHLGPGWSVVDEQPAAVAPGSSGADPADSSATPGPVGASSPKAPRRRANRPRRTQS